MVLDRLNNLEQVVRVMRQRIEMLEDKTGLTKERQVAAEKAEKAAAKAAAAPPAEPRTATAKSWPHPRPDDA